MTFALKTLSGLALVGLLAGTGASAMAPQGDHDLGSEINTTGVRVIAQATLAPIAPTARTARATQQGDHAYAREYNPAKMKAMMAKRHASLKTKLNITAAQEGAWATYTQAMQPPARMGQRPSAEQRAEFAKLTTPERIDKMRAMRTERMAEMSKAMDQRGDATKALYAVLSPEQQKTFDSQQHAAWGKAKGKHMRHQHSQSQTNDKVAAADAITLSPILDEQFTQLTH